MLIGDLVSVLLTLAIAAFFALPATRAAYISANAAAPLLLAFLKFALLATGGEILAWRMQRKTYHLKGFGLLPKLLLWGVFGVIIYWAFGIFSGGVPGLFPFLAGLPQPWRNILTAFAISLFLNLIFSPVFMLTHHLTDRFITSTGADSQSRSSTCWPPSSPSTGSACGGSSSPKPSPFSGSRRTPLPSCCRPNGA